MHEKDSFGIRHRGFAVIIKIYKNIKDRVALCIRFKAELLSIEREGVDQALHLPLAPGGAILLNST